MLQNSDESNNVGVIETSYSEFDDEEDRDIWNPMHENEYKLHKLMKSAFAQPFYEKLREMFPEKDPMFLLAKSKWAYFESWQDGRWTEYDGSHWWNTPAK